MGPRDARTDWEPVQNLAGADPEIPVVHLRDARAMRRDSVPLFSDEDRSVMADVIDRERRRQEGREEREGHLEIFDSWQVRIAGALFLIMQGVTIVLSIRSGR